MSNKRANYILQKSFKVGSLALTHCHSHEFSSLCDPQLCQAFARWALDVTYHAHYQREKKVDASTESGMLVFPTDHVIFFCIPLFSNSLFLHLFMTSLNSAWNVEVIKRCKDVKCIMLYQLPGKRICNSNLSSTHSSQNIWFFVHEFFSGWYNVREI